MVEIGAPEVDIYIKDFSLFFFSQKCHYRFFFINWFYLSRVISYSSCINFNPIEIKEGGVNEDCRDDFE